MIGFTLQLAFGAIVFVAQAMFNDNGAGFRYGSRSPKRYSGSCSCSALCHFGHAPFLAVDGHLALINAVVQSYDLVPVGSVSVSAASLTALVEFFGFDCIRGWHFIGVTGYDGPPAHKPCVRNHYANGASAKHFCRWFPVTILAGLFIMFLVMPGFLGALTNIFQFTSEQSLTIFS